MIELSVSLASNGVVKVPGYEQLVRFGYTKNRGVYRLAVTAAGEWEGLIIRAFWHLPGGNDPASSLVVDGYVAVPASVTAQPGNGCITFEGSDGTTTVTSADLRYRVSANSGTEDGTEPEPGTPAWQQLVDAVHTDATAAEQAKTDAQTAATESAASAEKAAASKKAAGDATLTQSGQAADAKVTGDELARKAVIDDTTVGTDAWSSKHIIDTLCPPIEEAGNPVQCYPVAGYPLGCKVSWEPTQEGTGDPSPENVRPIKGRDSVTVERCGANLLHIAPFSTETKNGVTFEYVPDGVRIQGTASANTDSPTFPVGHLPPGKYYSLDMGTGIAASIVVERAGKNLWLNAKGTFEIIQGDIVKYWYMIANNGNTANTTVYPYIVPGTTAPTAYSPYTGQTATLTLPRTIYGGTVDAVTGEGECTAKVIALDGNSLKFALSSNGLYWNLPSGATPGINKIIATSHFAKTRFSANTSYDFVFTQPKVMEDLFASVDDLNAYCVAQYAAGTPVQIAYKLATPTPFTATGAQPIPALSGVNTLMTDADSATVTGRADPIKRITDLEDAVASMTNT